MMDAMHADVNAEQSDPTLVDRAGAAEMSR